MTQASNKLQSCLSKQEVIIKLYSTPAGVWAGTEKDWKAAMKAEGAPTKDARSIVNVPTDKPGLLEFLTFHNVNVINPQPPGRVDIPADAAPSPAPASAGITSSTTVPLDTLFEQASLRKKLLLAVAAIDAADAALNPET